MTFPPGGGVARVRIALLLATVFASGILGGMALERVRAGRLERGRVLLKAPPLEDGIPVQLKRLGLTPEQERRMKDVATRWRPRADSVMQEVIPQVRGIQLGMFQEMACILTPEQVAGYLDWRKREGLNQAEGEAQVKRVRTGECR